MDVLTESEPGIPALASRTLPDADARDHQNLRPQIRNAQLQGRPLETDPDSILLACGEFANVTAVRICHDELRKLAKNNPKLLRSLYDLATGHESPVSDDQIKLLQELELLKEDRSLRKYIKATVQSSIEPMADGSLSIVRPYSKEDASAAAKWDASEKRFVDRIKSMAMQEQVKNQLDH